MVDIAAVCDEARESGAAQPFFMGIVGVFTAYVGLDMMVAMLAIAAALLPGRQGRLAA